LRFLRKILRRRRRMMGSESVWVQSVQLFGL
jgi:hypothetical protein